MKFKNIFWLVELVYLNKLIKTKIMKTKNDLKTGILIGIGMIVVPLIIMSSKPISSSNYSTPESHEWVLSIGDGTVYSLNKRTGEVRKYANSPSVSTRGDGWYITTFEREPKR